MTRAPVRVRLTAWYVAVLAVVLVALAGFVVARLRGDLTARVDRDLAGAADHIRARYDARGIAGFRIAARAALPGPAAGAVAQLLSGDGRVSAQVGAAAHAPLLSRPETVRVTARGPRRETLPAPATDERLRLIAVPAGGDRNGRALVVAESLEQVDDAVNRAALLLAVGGTGALVLAALGGWLIARRALAPVERMSRQADSIGIGDLAERIPPPRARDELAGLARTLNAMLARLQAGVDARERLIADASHELRAPLAAMRAELDVSLRHDELTEETRSALSSLRNEVVRMGRIVENLMTLARVDEGRLELLPARQDLRALAERAARAHRAAADAAGVALAVRGPEAEVAADGDRILQVLANLIDNALRHSPRGGTITLQTWEEEHDAGVTVTDEGPGIPPEERERLFERFARADAARGRDGGAGLGLAISRELTRAHGGHLDLGDSAGRGSAFVMALPRNALSG